MRSLLLLSLLFTGANAFVLTASAQTEFGVKGGFNYVNIIEKIKNPVPLVQYNRNSFVYRPAFHAGVYGSFYLNEYLTLHPELLYSQKGANRREDIAAQTYNFHYLNIPVLVGYEPIENLKIMAGLEFGYLISHSIKTDSSTIVLDPFFINKWEIGATLGARFYATERIWFGARYTYSFNSALANMDMGFTDPTGQNSGTSTVYYKNSTFQLSIGYALWKSE